MPNPPPPPKLSPSPTLRPSRWWSEPVVVRTAPALHSCAAFHTSQPPRAVACPQHSPHTTHTLHSAIRAAHFAPPPPPRSRHCAMCTGRRRTLHCVPCGLHAQHSAPAAPCAMHCGCYGLRTLHTTHYKSHVQRAHRRVHSANGYSTHSPSDTHDPNSTGGTFSCPQFFYRLPPPV